MEALRGYCEVMDANAELGEFLRSRRSRISPESVGLPTGAVRRVPGLRREELARLAGVSMDYYTRLEQGRHIVPSEGVLDAIATALSLDDVERTYLSELARARTKPKRRTRTGQQVVPGLLRFMDTFPRVPAYVLGRRTDVLAANRMACLLLADFTTMPARQRNAARWLLLDEGARSLYRNWEKVAADIVACLRLDAGRYPDDPRTSELVGELAMKSPEFRRWWANRRVVTHCQDVKRLHHPIAGNLELKVEALVSAEDSEQQLFVYLPEPGSRSEEALRLLAAWNGDSSAAAAPQPSRR